MKRRFYFLSLIVVLLIMITGCNQQLGPSEPLDNLDVPDDCYGQWFSPVEKAVLYVDGAAQQIEPNDPRLIRLLNLLAYARETMQYTTLQGYVYEEDIHSYYSSNSKMIEITFSVDDQSDHSIHRDTPKILVCGDSYILIVDTNTMQDGIVETHAERHWPFSNLAPEGANRSSTEMEWGNDYWLDILQYCGF